jgi:autotransporter-associated beta strand protein
VDENSDSIYLNAANTYTGGTILQSSGGVNFNNGSAFGTGGTIYWGHATTVLATEGATPITIANPVQTTSFGSQYVQSTAAAGNTQIIAAPAAPLTFSGAWTLAGAGTNSTLSLTAGSTVTISGQISGAGNYVLAGSGTNILSAVEAYTGTTTISGGVLKLGVAGALASSSSVILNGGILDLGGVNHIMTGTTLGLTASSIIDFEAGGSSAQFANSSGLTWAPGTVLDLENWNPSIDTLEFGTDSTGLTTAQLVEIEFNGAGLGTAGINSVGDIVVATPEPSSILLGLVGGVGVLWSVRRRKA